MATIVTRDVLKELLEKMQNTFVLRNDPSLKELSEKDRKVLDSIPEDIAAQIEDLKARITKLEGTSQAAKTNVTEGK